jgi:DNA-directed RNA polymerase subunit RPC12/RpoP
MGKKSTGANADIFSMMGVKVAKPERVVKKEVLPEKPKIDKTKQSRRDTSAKPELVPKATTSGQRRSLVIDSAPAPIEEEEQDQAYVINTALGQYIQRYHGTYVCRACGRDFTGLPELTNNDPRRMQKWDILLCPFCHHYGLVNCSRFRIEEQYKILEESIPGFMRNRPLPLETEA